MDTVGNNRRERPAHQVRIVDRDGGDSGNGFEGCTGLAADHVGIVGVALELKNYHLI